MGLLALIAFWVGIFQLWQIVGPSIPLKFIAIWLLALFLCPSPGWFQAADALLAIGVWFQGEVGFIRRHHDQPLACPTTAIKPIPCGN